MAVTMLTPRDVQIVAAAAPAAMSRWRRGAVQSVRQNLVPWLAVKSTLAALVVVGLMGFWTAFLADSVVSLLVVAYGWHLARR